MVTVNNNLEFSEDDGFDYHEITSHDLNEQKELMKYLDSLEKPRNWWKDVLQLLCVPFKDGIKPILSMPKAGIAVQWEHWRDQ